MRNLKVVLLLQERYDIDFVDYYSEVESYIVEIPAEQADIISNINCIFHNCKVVFGDICKIFSYSEELVAQECNRFKLYWLQLSKMHNGTSKWVLSCGIDNLTSIVADILRSNDKSLIRILCKLYGWKIVTKMPCVIDKIVSVVIDI